MASETKTHTRRSPRQDTVSDCETLQRTINRLRGAGIAPRGVYRFESHEEAERWQIQRMARIHAPELEDLVELCRQLNEANVRYLLSVKTTIEIPDELFRASKVGAAKRGQSLEQIVCDSLRARLESEGVAINDKPGWRRVFGRARSTEVREIDAIIEGEFERVDPDE